MRVLIGILLFAVGIWAVCSLFSGIFGLIASLLLTLIFFPKILKPIFGRIFGRKNSAVTNFIIWLLSVLLYYIIFIFTFGVSMFYHPFDYLTVYNLIPIISGSIIFLFIKNSIFGKVYHSKDFRGMAQENIRFTDPESMGKALYEKVKKIMEEEIKANGIPAKIVEAKAKSGGVFGKTAPMLVIKNTEIGCKFFDIGILVIGDSISFPLLGESRENTKFNKKKIYDADGSYMKAAFTNPDEFVLQKEAKWQQDVLACIDRNIS